MRLLVRSAALRSYYASRIFTRPCSTKVDNQLSNEAADAVAEHCAHVAAGLPGALSQALEHDHSGVVRKYGLPLVEKLPAGALQKVFDPQPGHVFGLASKSSMTALTQVEVRERLWTGKASMPGPRRELLISGIRSRRTSAPNSVNNPSLESTSAPSTSSNLSKGLPG